MTKLIKPIRARRKKDFRHPRPEISLPGASSRPLNDPRAFRTPITSANSTSTAEAAPVSVSDQAKMTATQLLESGERHVRRNLIDRLSHVSEVKLLVAEWCLAVFLLFLSALAQSFWYSNAYSTEAYSDGGTYTEATLGKITSLNPLFASTDSEKTLAKLLFSSLTTTDSSGHVANSLAQSIRSDSSAKVWTVKMRDNLKWSDGEALTMDDVIFTTKLIKHPDVVSNYAPALNRVKVYANANNELIFELPSAYPDFAAALNFPILPQHILAEVDPAALLEAEFSSAPVSSGPFAYNAVQTFAATGETIVYLSANEHYFKGVPKVSSFVVHAYQTLDEIKAALNAGTVSATAELDSLAAADLRENQLYQKQTALNSGVFLFLNTKSATLTKTARKAIRTGLDVAEIRTLIDGEIPLDYPLLASQLSLDTWPDLPAFDLAASRETVAGLEQKDLKLVTINSGYYPLIAEDITEQLTGLGFNVTKEVYEPGADFLVNVIANRNYDILLYEVDLGVDPDLLVYYHSSQVGQNGLNLANYASSVADDLILSAREANNEATRNAKYEAFIKRWLEDVPAIALYQTNLSYFFDHSVRTFDESLTCAVPTDRFTDVRFWGAEKTIKFRTP